jgi:lipoprotein-anchoring transpeptidase ErfK/SrfK
MTPNQIAAFKAIEHSQQALKSGDKYLARQYAEQAAQLAPELEEPWLMMAALAAPRASVAYLQKALQINPQSVRAQKGMAWATERLRKEQAAEKPAEQKTVPLADTAPVAVKMTASVSFPVLAPVPVSKPKPTPVPKAAASQKSLTRSRFSYLALLFTFLCLVAIGAIVLGVTPAAAIINSSVFSTVDSGPAWGQADVSKSTYTPSPSPTATYTFTPSPTFTSSPTFTATFTPTVSLTPTFTKTPTPSDTPTPTDTPSITPTDEASPTPLPTDTAMPTVVIPTGAPRQAYNPGGTGGERWIDVNLSQQMVYAYEGNTLINSFLVSTGTWQYPTVTGQYRIYVKYRYKDMSGPGYYLPNVPYTMFFYRGYALHGTYWHHNFGTPMSHGCVNLSIPDAEWLYNWASVGTLVNVHY